MNKSQALASIVVMNSMYVLMAIGAYYVHRNLGDNGIWMTVLIGVFGVLCGWVLGVLSSPLNAGETQNFGKFAGVIAAFVSGYLFTKFDRVVLEISENLLANPVYGLRTLIFVSCLISGVLIMYIQRAYLQGQDDAGRRTQAARDTRG